MNPTAFAPSAMAPLLLVFCAACLGSEVVVEPEPEELPEAARKFVDEKEKADWRLGQAKIQENVRKEPAPAPSPVPAAAEPAPPFELPPQVADALHGIEWEVLDAPPASALAYQVPADCRLEYAELGTLGSSAEGHELQQSYFQAAVLEKAGAGRMLRKPGRRLEYFKLRLSAGRGGAEGFLDPSAQRATPIAFAVAADHVEFPSVLSPLFQNQKGTAFGQPSPMNAWPPLPGGQAPEPEWKYNLLFDTPETLKKQAPAKVRLHGWVRLGFQRVAYLTATWPETGEPVAIGTELARLKVGGRPPKSSRLSQNREVTGHYLVSEHGYLALAHVEGMARIRSTYLVEEEEPGWRMPLFGARREPKKKPKLLEREFAEERSFEFTTKLLTDCSGSLFAKVPARELSDEETYELAERFASQVAADRLSDARELLAPSVRYAFPGDLPFYLLRGHFKALALDGLGRRAPKKDPARKGVDFEHVTKKGRRVYSTAVAAQMNGAKVLTFVGSSSAPDRKKWDLLAVEPGNVSSGVIRTLKPSF